MIAVGQRVVVKPSKYAPHEPGGAGGVGVVLEVSEDGREALVELGRSEVWLVVSSRIEVAE